MTLVAVAVWALAWALAWVVACANPAVAAFGPWQSLGAPDTASVSEVVVDSTTPGRLYAPGQRSVDGGATWTATDSTLGTPVHVAVDASTPGAIYGGFVRLESKWIIGPTLIYTLSVAKSLDAGTTWTPLAVRTVQGGYDDPRWYGWSPSLALAVDPAHPGTLYVGGVGKTTDDGATTWAPMNIPGVVRRLLVDPFDVSTVYALADQRGRSFDSLILGDAYRSTDAGATFAPVDAGIPDAVFSALAADPSARGRIYLGSDRGHVYRSTDGGLTWLQEAAGLPDAPVRDLAVSGGDPSVVYALLEGYGLLEGEGVFRSTDGGVHWNRCEPGTRATIQAIAADPAVAGRLYAGTERGGVLRSDSGGTYWTPSARGAHAEFESLAIDPLAPGTLYVTVGLGGVFKTTDGGASWAPIGDGEKLVIDPTLPTTLYLLGAPSRTCGAEICKTVDGGSSWHAIGAGLPTGLAFEPSLVVALAAPSTLYACPWRESVQKSLDGGLTWAPPPSSSFACTDLAVDPLDANTLYAVASPGDVWKSTDGAASWVRVADIPAGYPRSTARIAIDPQDPLRLYTGFRGSVDGAFVNAFFTTADGGASWERAADLPTSVDFSIDPLSSGLYVLGAADVLVGPVGAGSWSEVGAGAPPSGHRLQVSPNGRTLYAVASGLDALQLVACSSASDCQDGNPCTTDECEPASGACANVALDDGTACDDGDPCTVDVCTAGSCRALRVDSDGDGTCDAAESPCAGGPCEVRVRTVSLRRVRVAVRRARRLRVKGLADLPVEWRPLDPGGGFHVSVVDQGGMALEHTWRSDDCRRRGARIVCRQPGSGARLVVRPSHAADTRLKVSITLRVAVGRIARPVEVALRRGG